MNRLALILILALAPPLSAQQLPGTKPLTDTRSFATAPTPDHFLDITKVVSEIKPTWIKVEYDPQKFDETPYVKMPATLAIEGGWYGKLLIETNGKVVKWFNPPELLVFREMSDPRIISLIILGKKDGQYSIFAYTALADMPSEPGVCVVTVGKGPGPIPPIPPDPKPDPKPDPPVPPIPVSGMHVLVVYESAVASNTAKIMNSVAVRDYLNAKCVKEADGKSPSWRVLDKDANMANTSKEMQAMMSRPRASVPWLVIMSSKGVVEQALPSTIDETLAVLRKVGG